jgi:RNA 3'-terminal phosphate cyclase (ATP)
VRMGAKLSVELERPGFHPVGGGRVVIDVEGGHPLTPLALHERGALLERRAVAMVSNLPIDIAQREVATLSSKLRLQRNEAAVRTVNALGPGNCVSLSLAHEHITEVFTSVGARGVRAEEVARGVADEVTRYVNAGVPVGEHLADQLLLPLVIAGGGSFTTQPPSLHTTTNALVIERFVDLRVRIETAERRCRIDVA